ncbi:MAG: hypothetical protein AM324_012140 [Candidatus Thorarchaeota archaeon SMTZ1-83]
MEKMKINSKRKYRRSRVANGYGPHEMLKMAQEKALSKREKKVTPETDEL